MTRKRLPFTRLQTFEAVARLGSFVAARNEIEGSNVNRHVAELEKSLGVQLVDRTSRGTLTVSGKILAAHLTTTFDEIEILLDNAMRGHIDPDALVSLIQRREWLRRPGQEDASG